MMTTRDIHVHIKNKISKNEKIIIELGPGKTKVNKNAIGIDICEKESVDYVTDLNKGLTFLWDESVDEIYAFHFLEHINDLEFFLSEVFRVLKKGGVLIGTVPHFSNPYFYSDYTHSNFWGLYTWSYFSKNSPYKREVPKYYNNIEFQIIDIQLIFSSPFKIRNKIKKIIQRIFNMNKYMQEFYEENLTYLIPCYEIKFRIMK